MWILLMPSFDFVTSTSLLSSMSAVDYSLEFELVFLNLQMDDEDDVEFNVSPRL